MLRSLALTALALAFLTDCRCSRDGDRGPDTRPVLPALDASAETIALPVKGFGDAVVVVPGAVTHATPVLVAVLGIGDTPEEQCAAWRAILEGMPAFVLCPRGAKNMVQDVPEASTAEPAPAADPESDEEATAPAAVPEPGPPRQVGFLPQDLGSLDREVMAGLAALGARYGTYVDGHDTVYAGFSRGAFLGASLALKYPERFQRVILVEGGQSAWDAKGATSFASAGGKRVLFACGQQECADESERTATALRAQKIEARVIGAAGAGHTYKKQVQEELRRSFPWVVEGAPTWRSR